MDTTFNQKVREALEKVLLYPSFKRSPLLSKFLRFVVENTLDGNVNHIKEYTVGVEALDKPLSFNPQIDAGVRINATRLRKMLSEYYHEGKDDSMIRIELQRGSYIPVFSLKSDDTSLERPAQKGGPVELSEVVGILPFTALVNPATNDFSVIGFCEFLSNKLSLFEDIRVISFHSVQRFMKEDGRIDQIAEKLGLTYYISGSVEINNNYLLISYQLFEAKTHSLIWSQQIENQLNATEIVEAMNDISSQIVASLGGYSGLIHFHTLLNTDNAPPLSNKMANAIFWFYHYEANHTSQLFYKAIQRLESVVAEDPSCPLCWAVLAHLYADALIYNYQTNKNSLETAKDYVKKAFELDPECQHAHLVQGWLHILMRNREDALVCIEKTNAINPGASIFKAMCSLGMALTGEYAKSLEFLKQAKHLNPLPYWWMNLPEIFIALKKNEYEKAVFFAQKSSTPPVIFEHIFEMIGLFYLGDINAIKAILPGYTHKYPGGIDFLSVAFPGIIFDIELSEKIRTALVQIGKIEKQPGPHDGH